MPHIIVEYSRNIGEIITIPKMLKDMHLALAEAGIEQERIKSRAICCDTVQVGTFGSKGHMLHATLLLLEGRDVETKKKYGDILHQKMHNSVAGVVKHCSVTMEIREMDPDTYYL